MSLTAAAIIPHSPILVSTIGGYDQREKLKKTIASINIIKENLEKIKPDTLIILSPKINNLKNLFCINISENFGGDFKEFGEFKTNIKSSGDIGLALKIRRDEKDERIKLITKNNLDYETSIPLYFLTQNIKPKIIPIESSTLSLEDHFNFGKEIKEAIFTTNKKVAVIASVSLSSKTKKNSINGYTKRAGIFDKKIIDLLESKNIAGMLNLKDYLIKEVNEYGLKPIITLLGVLDEINYKPENLSYEDPFGIGYLTMNFKI